MDHHRANGFAAQCGIQMARKHFNLGKLRHARSLAASTPRRKRVGLMAHLVHTAIGQQHFHNVESIRNIRVTQQAQLIAGGGDELALLVGIHRGGRPGPGF